MNVFKCLRQSKEADFNNEQNNNFLIKYFFFNLKSFTDMYIVYLNC